MNKERVVNFINGKRVVISASTVGVSLGLTSVLGGRADRILSTVGAAFAHLALEGYYAVRRRVTKRTPEIKSSEDR